MTKDPKIQMEELELLARPLQEWIAENYHPYADIIVDMDSVRLTEDQFRVIFKDK